MKPRTNLGTANGWRGTPRIVFRCTGMKHPRRRERVRPGVERVSCDECGYEFLVDSSDCRGRQE